VTLRAGSSALVFALVAGGAVLLVGDAVIRGSWEVLAQIAGPALLIVWAAWMLLLRPSIRVQEDRAVVVNIGRITEVPWSRIVDIRRRLQLIFELDDGKSVEAWGSPFPKRKLVGKTAQTEDDDPSASVLRSAWRSGKEAGADAPVVRRPDVLALSIGVVALIAAAASVGAGA
jgi:hypothetical protein